METSAANLKAGLRTGLGCTDQELDLSWLCGVFVGTKKKCAAWDDSVRFKKSGLGVNSCSQLSLLPIGRDFMQCCMLYMLGSWVWGWGLEGAERTPGLYAGYFVLTFINAFTQWTALCCIYIME